MLKIEARELFDVLGRYSKRLNIFSYEILSKTDVQHHANFFETWLPENLEIQERLNYLCENIYETERFEEAIEAFQILNGLNMQMLDYILGDNNPFKKTTH